MQETNDAEERVRNVLANLREVLESEDPLARLSTPDARAVIDDAWEALAAAMGDNSGQASPDVLGALRQLRRIDQLLLRTQRNPHAEVSRRLGETLTRLEATPCSVRELITVAPRLIGDLGFDRAIVSRISDGLWISQGVFIADNPEWADTINRAGQDDPQALVPGLFETEMVRRRQAILVYDVQHESRVHRRIADESLSRSYVAAPIMSNGRVVGLVHGDRYLQGVDTDLLDREVLRAFAEGFRLALTRAQLAERLDRAGSMLRQAATEAAASLDDAHEVSFELAATDDGGGGGAVGAGAPVSRHPRASASLRERLTNREVEILELLAQGRTNFSIARELVIAEGTVKQHVKHILRKLGAANRAEAVSRLYEAEPSPLSSPHRNPLPPETSRSQRRVGGIS
ncbi:LuxR C-terminal-related transcriptional regulator [Nocardia shimofusensis]|uniref:LuxR C-terminal-related transcriptional regulator n=1 Tax=Nocardia shimofusensis TaxID=228596 RepID=UPI0012ECD62C|nr:LuxR C-terminal-related transcriptional regulator [Nocardia shimofusensis]